MPRAAKKSKGAPQFNTQFVRCELTAEDKKKVPAFAKKHENDFSGLVSDLLGENYKLSLSFSGHNDSYICSITGKADDCLNSEKCMTSHGKTYPMAIWAAMYKHYEIFQSGVWEDTTEDSDFG